MAGVFVPDMKLPHSRTARQKSGQNDQILHWRAAVIQAEGRRECQQCAAVQILGFFLYLPVLNH